VPLEIRKNLAAHFVSRADQVLKLALERAEPSTEKKNR
jgi:hypothetical protein